MKALNLGIWIKKIGRSRNLKYGSNAIIFTAVAIAIAMVVNIIMELIPLEFDLSRNKLYSINDVTREILEGLKKEVEIYGLFDDGKISESDQRTIEVVEMLKYYDRYPMVEVKYVDPEKNPGLIAQLDPTGLRKLEKGNYVVKSGSKIKKLTDDDLIQYSYSTNAYGMASRYVIGTKAEQAFTGAIKFVTSENTPVVYFTEGHEEGKPNEDFTNFREQIEVNNYEVKPIKLTVQEKVPDDAAAVVILAPKYDFEPDEVRLLREYVRGGGRLIVMADYLETSPRFDQLNNLLSEFNLFLNYDKVMEQNSNYHKPGDPYTLIVGADSAAVEEGIVPATLLFSISQARSIEILKNEKEYVENLPLIRTSPDALGKQAGKDDMPGPLNIAVSAKKIISGKTCRVLAIGNSEFISDEAMNTNPMSFRNGVQFFLSSLNWMVERKQEKIVDTKYYARETIEISENEARNIEIAVMYVMPGAILGLGLFIWIRRRYL